MGKSKKIFSVIVLSLVLGVGCSAEKDFSSMEASEIVEKTQSALEKISGEALHTVETTAITYPEGTDTVEIERWYVDGNCLYVGKQSDGIITTRIQYDDKVYTKTSVNENWIQTKEIGAFGPFGVKKDTAEQFSENSIVSWKEENGEYYIEFSSLPIESAQKYKKNQITLCYSKKWELLRVETLAEYSMESWVDGTVTEVVAKSIIEYQDTSAKQIKKQIEDTYELVCE
ncbi:MAG: hypothetical protein J6C07_09815 [Lachnospiraceae bacterium]|nr:hypothetical protein [Lachnospiraceae bacterium]